MKKETDKQRLTNLLNDFGIKYEDKPCGDGSTMIEIQTHSCEKVEGYGGFYTQFDFHEDDSFKIMGVWE